MYNEETLINEINSLKTQISIIMNEVNTLKYKINTNIGISGLDLLVL